VVWRDSCADTRASFQHSAILGFLPRDADHSSSHVVCTCTQARHRSTDSGARKASSPLRSRSPIWSMQAAEQGKRCRYANVRHV
jgi:hypothetical protein